MEESIFDTDQIKATKTLVQEVAAYVEEVEYLRKNKAEIDKEKQGKEINVKVDASFGKMPANASEFKTITIKKRSVEDITPCSDLKIAA